jgi:hypothetical protein
MITFTPYNASSIQLGGDASIGAFPKYGIQKDITAVTSEGGILNSKYTITISGTFIVPSEIDITDIGARQSRYNSMMAERINYLKTSKGITGKLEIAPYGGKPGKIIFSDARLLSVSTPESPENSSAILYSEYSLSFEAYIDSSIGDGVTLQPFDHTGYLLSSVEENWGYELDDNVSYIGNNITGDIYKNYVITHTVSATGIRKGNPGGTGFASTAWKEAERWVNTRLKTSPFDPITKEMLSNVDTENQFNGRYASNSPSGLIPNLDSFLPYNHTRIPEINISEGSYSVTETWSTSRSNASIDIDVNIEIDQNDTVSITVEGSIIGYDESPASSTIIRKIQNAELAFQTVKSNVYSFALSNYLTLGVSGQLSNVVRSSTVGKNNKNGTISFSFSYNDLPILINGAKNTNISINYDNDQYQVQTVAIIPVIARANGPVIQNMKTSKERRRSVQLDAVMSKNNRVSKPNGYSVVAVYAPVGPNLAIQSHVENWEPQTGNYSLSVEWIY